MNIRIRNVIFLAVTFLLMYALVHLSLQSFRVDGQSMEPSFMHGQFLLVEKLGYYFQDPQRGDVIVFNNPGSPNRAPLIKRIVGLPGELVEVEDGKILINGTELRENPPLGMMPHTQTDSMTVPDNTYYVMGDNRSGTTGSHLFGTVPREDIVGRVWMRYWPPSDISLAPPYAAALD